MLGLIIAIFPHHNKMSHLLIITTCPDQKTAETIANNLLINKLAACINILPGLTSVYQWKGKIVNEKEFLLIIKSHEAKYAEIEKNLLLIHPYELPEIIAVPVQRGLPDYLQWIDSCLSLN